MSIRTSVNSKQFILGFVALLIGLVEYVLSRSTDSTYLGKMIGTLVGGFSFKMNIFGVFGGVLPEFLHPFAFALFTMALFPRASRKVRRMICLFWLAIELFFEMGQCFGQQIAQHLLKVLPHRGVVDPLTNYFLNGTFDHLDVLAICVGITAAYIVSDLTIQGGVENDSHTRKHRKVDLFKNSPHRPALEAGS